MRIGRNRARFDYCFASCSSCIADKNLPPIDGSIRSASASAHRLQSPRSSAEAVPEERRANWMASMYILIVVASHNGRKYLKTTADGYAPNNLLALRECSNCPVIE